MDHRKWILLFLVLLLANPVLAQNNIVKIIGEQAVQDSDWTKINVDIVDTLDSTKILINNDVTVMQRFSCMRDVKALGNFTTYNERFYLSLADAYAPNAGHYDSTPAHDNSGENVHLDVVFIPEGWNNYFFWQAFTPYNTAAQENPNIIASLDGRTWVQPGGSRVLVDSALTGHDSDTDLIMGQNDSMWCFWRWTGSNIDSLFVSGSEDGINWGTKKLVRVSLDASAHSLASPAVIIDKGIYKLYFQDGGSGTSRLEFITCPTPDGTWSDTTHCTINNMPSGKLLWHLDVVKPFNDLYVSAMTLTVSTGGDCSLWIATSQDGLIWTTTSKPFLGRGEGGKFDDANIYRASLMPMWKDNKLGFSLWYPGDDGTVGYHCGYSEIFLGVKTEVFDNWDWAPSDPEDSVTVWRLWESDNYPFTIKFENESSQADQYDTLILSGLAPPGLPELFDSTYLKVDSMDFSYKTSSTDTNTAGVRFKVLKQTTWNGDTTDVLNLKSRSSTVANNWYRVGFKPDSLESFSSGDRLQIWAITKLDASHTVTIGKPRLFYKTQ